MGTAGNIANAAKSFACGIYKAMPGALIPTPASDILVLIWDEFCGNPPQNPPNLPPPGTQPFVGGQCCDKDYRVNFIFTPLNGAPSSLTLRFKPGRIAGVQRVRSGGSDNFRLKRVRCNGSVEFDDIAGGQIGATCTISSVVREDGLADNCGNPPKDYPVVAPPPPGGFTSPPTPVVINNGDSYDFTFNFTPPSAPAAPGNFLPPIIINSIRPTLELNIPIEFNFNGTINFSAPVTINFGQTDRDNITNIRNTTTTTNTTVNSVNTTVNNVNTNTTNHFDSFKTERDKDNNKPVLPTPFDPPKPAILPGKADVERLAFVEVNLTAVPINARKQLGNIAPDVIYAGWFEFSRGTKSMPRQPIHFVNNVFVAPTGTTGYAFTLYNGFQGNAVAITNKV